MPHYWDFTFSINDESTGLSVKDRAVTCDLSDKFPSLLVEEWVDEEFGETAKLQFISIVEISEKDYLELAKTLGIPINV